MDGQIDIVKSKQEATLSRIEHLYYSRGLYLVSLSIAEIRIRVRIGKFVNPMNVVFSCHPTFDSKVPL